MSKGHFILLVKSEKDQKRLALSCIQRKKNTIPKNGHAGVVGRKNIYFLFPFLGPEY